MDGERVMRHEWLKWSAGRMMAILLAAGVCLALAGCEKKPEKAPMITAGVINIGPAANFPAGTANTTFFDRYGFVVVNDSGRPLAIHPKCPHDGSLAVWVNEKHEFYCPSCGTEYDLLGRVIKGAGTRPLPEVVAEKQADGTLTVDLTRLYAQ